MIKNLMYGVTMQRWGDNETHNYVLGVFTTKLNAKKAGELEREYRGGKYEYCITIHIIDDFNDHNINILSNNEDEYE